MKRSFLICVCFLFCISCWAEKVTVDLFHRGYAEDRSIDRRSISVEPTAAIDGNIISIDSYISIENLQITIKDVDDNVVYSDVVIVSANQTYSFVLNATPGEEYTIELAYGDSSLCGSFKL